MKHSFPTRRSSYLNSINFSSFEFGAEKRHNSHQQKKQKQMTPKVQIQKVQPTSFIPKPSPVPRSFLPQPSPIPRSPFPSLSFSQISDRKSTRLNSSH